MVRTGSSAKPTMVQLTEELIESLDARAARENTSRSRVIRDAVEAYLKPDRADRLARLYRDAYERLPPGTPDDWGSLEDWHEQLQRARAGAPDAEERW